MSEWIFSSILILAAAYTACGGVVAVLFFTWWIKGFGPEAAEGSLGFRLLITPGVIALWPLILMRVRSPEPIAPCAGAEGLRRAHRLAFILLAVFGILVFTAALVWRVPAFADLPATEIPTP